MNVLYINWDVDPIFFYLFDFPIRYYGLLFGSGIMVSYLVIKKIFILEKYNINNIETLVTYVILGILIGARLGHCIFYDPKYYISNPIEIFLPIQIQPNGDINFVGYQGLASHGGVLGLIIALILFSRKMHQPIMKVIDLVAIVAPIGGFFIRMANLMNSEIIGKQSSLPWAFVFKRIDNIPRHPTQIYEGISYFIVFIILYTVYKRKRETIFQGELFGLSLILIFSMRFIIEFVKEHQVSYENEMILDMGQLLSIPYILLGIILILLTKRSGRLLSES